MVSLGFESSYPHIQLTQSPPWVLNSWTHPNTSAGCCLVVFNRGMGHDGPSISEPNDLRTLQRLLHMAESRYQNRPTFRPILRQMSV